MGSVTGSQSASNLPQQLTSGNDQGALMGVGGTLATGLADKIGFLGGLGGTGGPVVLQTGNSNYSTLSAAGSTTALYSNSTSTGGTGATAYTFGDIIYSLKQYGLLKS